MEKEVSLAEVRHMAKLSRLTVDELEEQVFARQFASILGYMDILNAVDVTDVEPLYSPLNHPARLREDRADNKRSQSEVLKNAPETDGETFMVPRIV